MKNITRSCSRFRRGDPRSLARLWCRTGAATLDARFPGQWFQAETGLHYNWHRSYDPTLGRYTQPDPLGFIDGPSVYGYAMSSPLRHVDQDGRNAATVVRALQLARECAGNPIKCQRDILCPALQTAKQIACSVPGCKSPSMQSSLAHFRLRAAEACLAARDAINAFCPLGATKKHQTPWVVEREQYERKCISCQAISQSRRIYPWSAQ